MDECGISNGGCSQLCHNEAGAHACSCVIGYELEDDQRTCRGMESKGSLDK